MAAKSPRKASPVVEEAAPALDSAVPVLPLDEREIAFKTAGSKIIKLMRNRPVLDADALKSWLEQACECEAVLLGCSDKFARFEAVRQLRAVMKFGMLCSSVRIKDVEASRIVGPLLIELRHLAAVIAKKHSLDAAGLLRSDAKVWLQLEVIAKEMDGAAGVTMDVARHIAAYEETEAALQHAEHIWQSAVVLPFAIEEKMGELEATFPEPAFADRIAQLRALFEEMRDGDWFSRHVESHEENSSEGDQNAVDAKTTPLIHQADSSPPAEFSSGPLVGTQAQLALWILNNEDRRALATPLKNGLYWARRRNRKCVEVWFRTQKRFAEANTKRLQAPVTNKH